MAFYLSLGLHKGRPSYRRNHQPSKENIQHFKRWKFCPFFYFLGSFLPSWIRILIRNLYADPDPAAQINADPCVYFIARSGIYNFNSKTIPFYVSEIWNRAISWCAPTARSRSSTSGWPAQPAPPSWWRPTWWRATTAHPRSSSAWATRQAWKKPVFL